jgi:ParB/RepB/Spo0J family partition protein
MNTLHVNVKDLTIVGTREYSKTLDDELLESIKEHGVLVPVIVRPLSAGGHEVVAGRRRVRAAIKAGLERIPAVDLGPVNDSKAAAVEIVENLQRAGLSPLDESDQYAALVALGKTVPEVAALVAKSSRHVYDRLRLRALIDDAAALVRRGLLTAAHAVILARLSPDDQKRAIDPKVRFHGAPLFEHEAALFDEHDGPRDRWHGLKAKTAPELQAWVNKHVRFDAQSEDVEVLFPETADALVAVEALNADAPKRQQMKVYHLTTDPHTHPDARSDERVYTPASWKQASTECPKMGVGVFVVGHRRGESIPVCVDKTCKTHWGRELREKAKRSKQSAATPSKAEQRYQEEQRRREQNERRIEAAREHWTAALPKIQEACVAAIAEARENVVLESLTENEWANHPLHKALESPGNALSLLRHMVLDSMIESSLAWHAFQDFPKRAKRWGVNVKAILKATPKPKAEDVADAEGES